MRTGILRTGAGLVGLIALTLGPASAQEAIPVKPVEAKPAPLEPGKQADGHTLHAESQEVVENGAVSGLTLYGEYLLLKPNRGALDVAITAPNLLSLPVGTVDNLNWETRSGFRAGAGWRLSDGWEIMAGYTHLDSSQSRTFNAPAGGTLLATMTAGGGNELVGTAVGLTSLQFHTFDLDVSKYCTVTDSFVLRFFGGGRYAIIDQRFAVLYTGNSLGSSVVNVDSPVDFNGGGITAGAEGIWNCWHGLGLYGRGRVGMLAGTFNSSLTETTNSGQVVIVNVSDKYYRVVPLVEVGAGVCWQNEHWRFKLGWELANYFNMVNSLDFPNGNSVGHITRRISDLSLDGLAVQLGVVF